MDVVAHERAHEATERLGRASGDERDEPVDDGDEEHGYGPQREPHEMREREKQAEEDREAGSPQVVVQLHGDRMRRRRMCRARLVRIAVWIAVREHRGRRRGPRRCTAVRTPRGRGSRSAFALVQGTRTTRERRRCRPRRRCRGRRRGRPTSPCTRCRRPPPEMLPNRGAREDQRGQREEDAKPGDPSALSRWGIQRHVDRVGVRSPVSPGYGLPPGRGTRRSGSRTERTPRGMVEPPGDRLL